MRHFRNAVGLNFTSLLFCVYFLLVISQTPEMISSDSDLVLHISYGKALISGGLPQSDPLLSGSTEAPVLQEWLFEIVMARLDTLCGLGGPLLVAAVLIGTLIAWLFQSMRRKGVCLWIAMLYANLTLLTLKPHLVIRPHLVSWIGTALLWALLEDWRIEKRTFALTVLFGFLLMALWANLHGGFLLGLVLAGIIVAAEGFELSIRRKNPMLLKALVGLAVFALATALNPWGFRLHGHLMTFLTNDFLIRGTNDFQPPTFSDRTLPALLIALLFILPPLLIRWRKVAICEWLLLFFLSAISFRSVRNLPFFGILMFPIAARHIQALLQRSPNKFAKSMLDSSERMELDTREQKGWLWVVGLLLFAGIAIGSGRMPVKLSGPLVPIKALNWVIQQKELHKKPVFADFLAAGYLLYATPVERVYLHALNANYPEERLKTWIRVEKGGAGWEQALNDIEWAFLLRGTSQLRTFKASSSWRPIFSGDKAIIFKKTVRETFSDLKPASEIPGEMKDLQAR